MKRAALDQPPDAGDFFALSELAQRRGERDATETRLSFGFFAYIGGGPLDGPCVDGLRGGAGLEQSLGLVAVIFQAGMRRERTGFHDGVGVGTRR